MAKPYAIRNTLSSYERLKRGQHIDTLFHTGKAFSVFPVKFIWRMLPRDTGEKSPVRAAFTVPKKKFRKASQRNYIRRLLKEAWRLQKHMLYAAVPPQLQLHVFIIFTDVKKPDFLIVQEAILKGVEQLSVKAASHA